MLGRPPRLLSPAWRAADAQHAAAPIPLIDFSRSRSSSPYQRARSAAQSEDEDDEGEWLDGGASPQQPLVAGDGSGARGRGRGWWRRAVKSGGLGDWLRGTWMGWQVYVGVLAAWAAACGLGLLVMNRFILWTGVYKFPYPLTATLIQLIITHALLLGSASLSRALARPLRNLGLGAVVAPAYPAPTATSSHAGRRKAGASASGWLPARSGGIAGGGVLEFERVTAYTVLPLAVVYLGKVLLSNISFAYAVLPMYILARISIIPLTLLLTATLTQTSHSTSTLSSSLTATFNLLVASIRPGVRVTWESILAGVFSTLFAALYPILLQRTHRILTDALMPQGDILPDDSGTGPSGPSGGSSSSSSSNPREDTRAYWRTLHYTSLLSVLILTPIVLLSGEIGNIRHNCYFLDVPFFWLLTFCGGLAGWAVFASTLLLVKATSPLTANFVGTPRAALQLVALSGGRMPVHAWVGVSLCWVSSAWYLWVRREEGRAVGRLRLEGR